MASSSLNHHRMTDAELEQFNRNVVFGDNGCVLWTGLTRNGYGRMTIRVDGKNVHFSAHRLAYEYHIGRIPDGLSIDHLCRVTACVRPDHLEAVTHAENIRRGRSGVFQSNKTHCPKGHPYSGYNVMFINGHRHCRECNVSRTRERRKRDGLVSALGPYKERTHCIHGHEFNEANTRIKRHGNGLERVCRTCCKERDRAASTAKPE